jgi:hypothetical protein
MAEAARKAMIDEMCKLYANDPTKLAELNRIARMNADQQASHGEDEPDELRQPLQEEQAAEQIQEHGLPRTWTPLTTSSVMPRR